MTVTVGDSGDPATEGTDYTAVADLTLTITAGDTRDTDTFPFEPLDDAIADTGETVAVSATAAGFTIAPLELTITDDDAVPTVIVLELSQASAAEGETPTVTVTATLSPDSVTLTGDTVVTVTVGDSGDPATEGTDYTAVADLTLTILAGETRDTDTFQFEPQDDAAADTGETVTVSATATDFTIAPVMLTITDEDEAPTVILLELSQASAAEGETPTVTVTATLSPPGVTLTADTVVTVTVGDSGDPATEGTDYTAVADLTLTITAGDTRDTDTFPFEPLDDAIADTGETVAVSATAAGFTIAPLELTITDDDAVPTVIVLELSQASAAEGETPTVTVTATLSPDSVTLTGDTVVTVTVGDSGDPATEGTDYTAVADLTLTILAGETRDTDTFQFEPQDDAAADTGETVTVSATAVDFTIAPVMLTITDEDEAPTVILLELSQASAAEGETPTVTVTATLSPPGVTLTADTVVTVTVGDSGDPATEGTDYTAVADLTLTITAGDTRDTDTFPFEPLDDAIADTGETVAVSATAAGFTIAPLELTITDDDAVPTVIVLELSQASAAEGETPTVTVTATLSPDSVTLTADTVVTVTVGDSGDPATEGTDYTAVADLTLTITAGETRDTDTFPFEPLDDAIADTGETVAVSATAVDFTIAPVMLTITDEDEAPTVILLELSQASAAEGETPTVTVTATLSPPGVTLTADTVVTVTVGDSGDPATEGTDYTAVADLTLTITAGDTRDTDTFPFEPLDDAIADTGETVAVSATAAGFTIAPLELTITDDDAVPTVIVLELSQASAAEGETPTVTVTATLSPPDVTLTADTVVTVTVGDSGDPATEGTDYTAVADLTLTITAGDTRDTDTFPFEPLDDAIADTGETVAVSATAAGFTIAPLELTITDDDAVPTVIELELSQASAAEGETPTVTVTATLSPTSVTLTGDTVVTVTVGDSGDPALEGTDYTAVADLTLTITAGDTRDTGTFSFAPLEDAIADTGETVAVSATAAGFTIAPLELTITDGDAVPTVIELELSQASAAEGETPTVTVTATLSPTSVTLTADTVVTVTVGDSGDPALEGTDYTAVADLTLTITAGDTRDTGTFPFAPLDDAIADTGETVAVSATAAGFTIAPLELTITDDDAVPTVIVLELSQASAAEGETPTVTVTATLSPDSVTLTADTVVTVTVGDSGDPALEGTDYTAVADLTLTITAGDTRDTGTFPFEPLDDAIADTGETVAVSATAAGFTIAPLELTITDDDAVPTVIVLELSQASAAEGETPTVTVTATLSPTSVTLTADTVVTVTVGDSGDPALEGTDYTAVADLTLTITAGDTRDTGTFSFAPLDDAIADTGETVAVSATAAGFTIAPLELTITDDDAVPTVIELELSQASAAEGETPTVTVTATLSPTSVTLTADTVVTVTVGDSGDPALEGTDYTAVADLTLTITAGDTRDTGTFSFAPLEDAIADTGETVAVSATAAGFTIAPLELTITDDDAVPTVIVLELSQASAAEGETPTVTVTATLSPTSVTLTADTVVTVTVGDSGDPALEGTDYTAVADLTLTITAGDTRDTGTFSFAPLEDAIVDTGETVAVSATAAGFTIAPLELTITDGDAVPTVIVLELSQASAAEGASPTVTVTAAFPGSVTLTDATVVTVVVGAGTDSAAEGMDYDTVADLTVTIAAGATSGEGTFLFAVTDDAIADPDETVTVSGTTTAAGFTPITSATLTITDNDTAGVTINPTTLTVTEEGPAATYTVVLASVPTGTVVVSIATDSDTAPPITFSPASLSFAPGTWATAQTVTVTATEDDDALGGTRTLSHTVSGYGTVTSAASIVVTVTDNDTAPAAVILSAAAVGEGDGTMTVTATLDNAVQGGLTVTAWTADGTATAGSDYTMYTKMMTFAGTEGETQTFPVEVIDDSLVEGDETFTVSLTGPDTLPDTIVITSTATVTILDDDTAPTEVVLSLTPTRVAGDSGITTITVTAAYPGRVTLAAATEVTVSVATGTASAADFTAVPDFTLTIAALSSSSTGSFDLTVTEDEETEGDETLTVSGATTGFAVTPATLTILGNNGALEVLLPELAHLSVVGVLDKVVDRIEQVVSGVADPSARFAGHTSLALALAANEQVLNDGEMSWREVLGRSSFAVQLDDTDVAADGPSASDDPARIWVAGNYERASSKDDELGAWSGGLFTLHAGVDASVDKLLSGEVMAGLSAFWSQGRFDFSENGSLDMKTLLAGLIPYIAWYSEDGSTLWATAGVGRGTSKQDVLGTERDLAMRMLAIGGSRNIVDGTALEVDVKGEVSGTRLTADAADGLPAMTADVHRLRLALEAGRVTVRDSGAQLAKFLSLGVRHDGGDGETGFGAEFDGGMSWSNPASGVSLSIIGHTLLAHEEDLEEWGLGGLIRYAPTPGAGRGLQLQAEPVYGRPETDSGQIWEHRVTDLELAGDREPEARLAVDVSYGLPALTGRGLLTPYAGLELSEGGDRVYRLGGRFEAGSGIHIDLGGDRKEEDDGGPEYGIHLAVRMHW